MTEKKLGKLKKLEKKNLNRQVNLNYVLTFSILPLQ